MPRTIVNKLNESCRKNVAEIVIEYLIHNKIHASPRFLEEVSNSIVTLFKSEIKVSSWTIKIFTKYLIVI